MDKAEAARIAAKIRTELERKPYAALVGELLDKTLNLHQTGAAGVEYQIEVQGFWDARESDDLRVIISVDGGGWSAFRPLTTDFIMRPDGSIV